VGNRLAGERSEQIRISEARGGPGPAATGDGDDQIVDRLRFGIETPERVGIGPIHRDRPCALAEHGECGGEALAVAPPDRDAVASFDESLGGREANSSATSDHRDVATV
jgi:hypothetical protein